MERHNNFDLLRLLAALSVIFSHAFLLAENSQDHDPLMILTGGQAILGLVGVFVFFTISGYLVSQSFERSSPASVFLAKRALRIFPGLLACLLVCVFVVGPLVTDLPMAEYLRDPGTYAYLLHNAVLDIDVNRLPGVWFGPGDIGGIVNGPLWSLPCEALLYVVLFGLGLCGLLTLPMSLAMVGLGMVCLWFDTPRNIDGLFGSAGWLLGFFAAGMCAYRLGRERLVDNRWALLALAGLALSIPLNLFLIAFPICGGYLVMYAALHPRLPVVPAARFGDLSYGLYIYGWPIEQCVVRFSGGGASWWQLFVISTAIALPTAYLSWHGIEKRCRWRVGKPRPIAAAAPSEAAASS